MEPQETHFEEHSLFPEHVIPPEYTPEYPDMSYFQESYVTAREENIFQGETPPGEEDLRALRREERKKRARFSWLRSLLGSALRGGAVVFGMCALVVTLVSGADLPEDSPWAPVESIVSDLKREPLHTPEDYSPEELLLLWKGDPEGPHQYDFEHAHLRREASCREDGIIEYYCTECGVALPEIIPGGHAPAAAVRENERAAGCTEDGGYDNVVYCSICHEEMSRTHTVYEATGHTSAEPVMENIKGALCTRGGSYDTVVYCSVCHSELSRETATTDAMGHTAAEAVKENEAAPSCTESGSYDSVVYCSVCHEEISRERVTVDALGHHPGFAGKENENESSCTEAGSYDSVIYCMVCGEELSREKVTLPLAEHIETQDIEENRVDPDCVTEGSADITVYCDICGKELRRETVVLEALGHTEDEALVENETEPTCTEEGGFDEVVYCMVCGEEISREHTVIEATGHSWGEPAYTWSSDNNSVTATRTCQNDPTHEETETVTAGSTVTTPATCTAAGSWKYTVTFSNSAFTAQTKDVTVPATGHNWGEPTYAWSSDNSKVTATRTCRNDSSHKETETATVSSSVTAQASCTAAGIRTYTASFTNAAFAKQTKNETIAALGHSYTTRTTAATCTAQGYTTYTCSRCGNSYKDNYTSALGHTPGDPVRQENRVEATCTTDGSYDSQVVHCTVCGEVLSKEHHVITAHGHSFNMTYEDESTLYCGYGCGTPAVTISFSSSPSGNGTFYYTLNSDFVSQLNNYGCEATMHVETADDSRNWVNDEEAVVWSGGASGSLLGLTWGSYRESYPSGSRLNVRLLFIYWDDSHEYCACSPTITITIP